MKKILIILVALLCVACTMINVNSQNPQPVLIQNADFFERIGVYDYEIPHIPVNLNNNLIIAADGQRIIYSGLNYDDKTHGKIVLVDIKSGKKDFIFQIPLTTTERVEQILLSPNSTMLYARTKYNAAIWSIEDRRLLSSWVFQGDPEDGIIYDNKLYSMGSFYDTQTGDKLSGPIQIRPYRHASMSPNHKFTFLYGDLRFKTQTFYNDDNKKVDYFELGGVSRNAVFSNDSEKLFVNHDLGGLYSGKYNAQAISVIDTQTVKVISKIKLPMSIVDMAPLKNGNSMLIASNWRIYRISTDTYNVESDYDVNVTTSGMTTDHNGRIWFGTWNLGEGVGRIGFYDPDTDSVNIVNKPTGNIVQIAVTNDGKHLAYGIKHDNNKKITVYVEKILK